MSTDAMVVSCDYCHTQSHIQRRTRMLQLPVRMPPTRGGGNVRPARQVVRRSMVLFSSFMGLVPVLVLSAVIHGVNAHFDTAAQAVKSLVSPISAAHSTPGDGASSSGGRWIGTDPPLFADADGDQIADVIGRVRYVQDGDRAHLVALSGAGGKRLWQSSSLGTYSSTLSGRTARVGDLLLFADSIGALTAIELAGGKTRFTAALNDRAERYCRRGETAVVVVTADGAWHEIALADGALRRIRKEPRCDRIPHDERGEVDPGVTVDRSPRRSSQAGMRLIRELRRSGGPAVAAGRRSRGTAVPMVAGLDERGRVTWKAEVPDGRPLEARQDSDLWTVTGRHVCTTYERTDRSRTTHMTCFTLDAGARAWDIELPTDGAPLRSLASDGERLYLSGWGLLLGIDAATGSWLPGFGP